MMTKSPNNAFLRTYPPRQATHDCTKTSHIMLFRQIITWNTCINCLGRMRSCWMLK